MSGPVLIQGAMDVETGYLVSRLEAPKEYVFGGFRFWRGSCRGLELVVSRTEIGTICAACATALGIREFAPVAVVNQGVAGGHSEVLHVGDIVVGRSCVHLHDLITPPKGEGAGFDAADWAFHEHSGPAPLTLQADPVWAERFEAAPYEGGAKVSGRLGSGDVFNREYDRILWLHERAGELCEDMESIGTYQVCHRFGVPCVGLRILSNNELTGEPYQREVGVTLQKFVLEALLR